MDIILLFFHAFCVVVFNVRDHFSLLRFYNRRLMGNFARQTTPQCRHCQRYSSKGLFIILFLFRPFFSFPHQLFWLSLLRTSPTYFFLTSSLTAIWLISCGRAPADILLQTLDALSTTWCRWPSNLPTDRTLSFIQTGVVDRRNQHGHTFLVSPNPLRPHQHQPIDSPSDIRYRSTLRMEPNAFNPFTVDCQRRENTKRSLW